jgi:hypothetical protein
MGIVDPKSAYIQKRLENIRSDTDPYTDSKGKKKRKFILYDSKTQEHARFIPAEGGLGSLDRLRKYVSRRQRIAGQLLVLGELIREYKSQPINAITVSGAVWQLHHASGDTNAAHTAPCTLLFNGHLPHVPVQDILPLAHEIILNFADVMIMPQGVNKLDTYLDDKFVDSKKAFADAMSLVIVQGHPAREALDLYLDERTGKIGEIIEESFSDGSADRQEELIDLRDRLRIYQARHVDPKELEVYGAQLQRRIENDQS